MPYSSRLALELRTRRENAGMSQDDLIKRAGIKSQNTISLLERNVPDRVGMEEVVRIGKVFGLTPNDLARIAGWWSGDEPEQESLDPRVREILQELPKMDKTTRERLIDMMYNLLVAFRVSSSR